MTKLLGNKPFFAFTTVFGASVTMATFKTFGTSYNADESYRKNKLIYPAATRNKEPILQVMKQKIFKYFGADAKLYFLEISSGSGQHVAHFAPNFPSIVFQPTEFEEELIGSIGIYAEECPTKNIKAPIILDVCQDFSVYSFNENSINVIYNANMMHIAPYECSVGLFTNAGKYLKAGGLLITYGPFAIDGVISPESNIEFDESLRSRNPKWGLRDLKQLRTLAEENKLSLREVVDMPANNKCVLWKKI